MDHVKGKVIKPHDIEGKSRNKKFEIKANRILVESIRDYLIPYVSGLNTSKRMYDALVG